jgi:hypothetical protein
MWAPWLALMLLESTASPPPVEPPDRALLEFLAEFEATDPEADADLDPLWLATPDAAAQLEQTSRETRETDTDAEKDDDRPR